MSSITDRIDNITKITDERFAEVIPAPKSVKIELTGRCNYRCAFCALALRDSQPTEDMDFELFKKITKDMSECGVEEIGLFYIGESFMNPKLLEDAVKYLKTEVKMPYVFLTTNGSLAKPDIVERLMEAGLDSLKWSINTSDEEQFKTIVNSNPFWFKKTFENIKSAWNIKKSKGYKTGLYASSIKYDGDQFEKMKSLLDEHVIPYVDQHYWLPLYSMASFTTEREAELGYTPTAGNQGRLDALRQPLPCWSVFTEGHVRSDGGLSVCCFDATGTFVVGDLKTQTFMEAWNSEKFREFRRAHLNKNVVGTPCEKCAAYN